MKYKINTNLFVEYSPPRGNYPERISIFDDINGITLWNQEETFLLAYKLMSLGSEMSSPKISKKKRKK